MILRETSIIFISVMALGLLIQAALVLIRKKPIIYDSSKYSFWIIPLFIISLSFTGNLTIYITAFPILLLLIVTHFVLKKHFKGVSIMGGVGDEFRERLIDFMNEQNIEYEQIPTAVYLKKSGITLHFSYNKLGMGRITLKGEGGSKIVSKIVTELRQRDLKVNFKYSYYTFATVLPFLIFYIFLVIHFAKVSHLVL